MANTLLLDLNTWDLCVDASGNIAMATEPYSLAQDVASTVRLFLGELYYDTTQGVPYFQTTLGQFPSMAFLKGQIVAAALTVPGVETAVVYITQFSDRIVTGQIQITDTNGTTTAVNF